MERYFTISETSEIYKDYFAYKENGEKINNLYIKLAEQVGIESRLYYVINDEIHIVPTEKDSVKFLSQLCNPDGNGLCKFKKNSKIAKGWIEALKDEELKILRKPMVIIYFKLTGGRYRSRLFDYNNTLYCSVYPATGAAPEGFTEIKASEFYKIIESAN